MTVQVVDELMRGLEETLKALQECSTAGALDKAGHKAAGKTAGLKAAVASGSATPADVAGHVDDSLAKLRAQVEAAKKVRRLAVFGGTGGGGRQPPAVRVSSALH